MPGTHTEEFIQVMSHSYCEPIGNCTLPARWQSQMHLPCRQPCGTEHNCSDHTGLKHNLIATEESALQTGRKWYPDYEQTGQLLVFIKYKAKNGSPDCDTSNTGSSSPQHQYEHATRALHTRIANPRKPNQQQYGTVTTTQHTDLSHTHADYMFHYPMLMLNTHLRRLTPLCETSTSIAG